MKDPEESNVCDINGETIAQPGAPDPEVVRVCTDLLERAQSGEICGVTVIMNHSDGGTSSEGVGYRDWRKTIGELMSHVMELAT